LVLSGCIRIWPLCLYQFSSPEIHFLPRFSSSVFDPLDTIPWKAFGFHHSIQECIARYSVDLLAAGCGCTGATRPHFVTPVRLCHHSSCFPFFCWLTHLLPRFSFSSELLERLESPVAVCSRRSIGGEGSYSSATFCYSVGFFWSLVTQQECSGSTTQHVSSSIFVVPIASVLLQVKPGCVLELPD
jgi:hypothetical protein